MAAARFPGVFSCGAGARGPDFPAARSFGGVSPCPTDGRLAAGTAIAAWHFGHLTRLPPYLSGTRNARLHCGHLISIGTRHSLLIYSGITRTVPGMTGS